MEVARVLRADCDPKSKIAIDSTKRHFCTTLEDGKVTRWSVARGTCEVLRGHMRRAVCLVFSPRSDLLCTGSYDHTLRLWNMDGCECIATLEGHEDEVTCVAFDPRGRMVCSGSADKSLKLWRVMDGSVPPHQHPPTPAVTRGLERLLPHTLCTRVLPLFFSTKLIAGNDTGRCVRFPAGGRCVHTKDCRQQQLVWRSDQRVRTARAYRARARSSAVGRTVLCGC